MPLLFWDASGLAKRYYTESGTETVHGIFEFDTALPRVVSLMGYAETAAILRRKFNSSLLTETEFQTARMILQAEVLLNPGFDLLTITDQDILDGMAITDRHNLNTADAAMLAAYLNRGRVAGTGLADCLLIASDKRLIRAAEAEGLFSLNPETVSPTELSSRIHN